jgi:predicted AAA+ superfamily ATPase
MGFWLYMNKRYKYQHIFDFLRNTPQMIFISGPRQSGKTTFAKSQRDSNTANLYFNWDIAEDRKKILQGIDFNQELNRREQSKSLVIFDEIHKYSDWKNYLKGLYDAHKDDIKFIVTGSGRLDFFQKGKDSLAGRYFMFHMWPLTLAEFSNQTRSVDDFIANALVVRDDENGRLNELWKQLSDCSGFPDPFFSANEKLYRVWSDTYRNQLIREDVRQLTRLEKIDHLEHLVLLLPSRVGAPLSVDNLAQDLHVAFDSVKKWLIVLARFYICFRIGPWSKKISRSITREQKLYLFDYAAIQDAGAKFENMVALELLRAVTNWREMGEGSWDLNYVRDRNKREVDFLITKNQKPFLLIEVKISDTNPSESLIAFQKQLGVPGVQLVTTPGVKRYIKNAQFDILICTAVDWLSQLP